MKRIMAILTVCVLLVGTAGLAFAESNDPSAFLSILTDGKTNWNFTDEQVDENDLHTILEAGVNTASAINEQP